MINIKYETQNIQRMYYLYEMCQFFVLYDHFQGRVIVVYYFNLKNIFSNETLNDNYIALKMAVPIETLANSK